MKNQFKLLLLILITSAIGNAQVKEIFNKSYDTQDLKSLNLQFNGTYVELSLSEDDKEEGGLRRDLWEGGEGVYL